MKFNNSTFRNHLQNLLKNNKQNNFLLAISGGVDSMVLLHLFKDQKLPFQVAHVNYGLRGADSDLDENLVREYCDKNRIKFHVYHVTEKDHKPDNSIQLWARNLRYDFFRNIMDEEQIDTLVTAHHLNDQLETFLINLSRGSGIKGLSGIPENSNNIIRPLLPFSKEEIYSLAKDQQIEYREDQSNKKNDYLRNKIRNTIVPHLAETHEQFLSNFAKTLSHLKESQVFIKEQINAIFDQLLIDETDEKLVLDKEHLEKYSDYVKFEILQKFGFENRTEIAKIFTAETGKSFYSQYFQLIVNREQLIITENKNHQESFDEIVLIQSAQELTTVDTTIDISAWIQSEITDNSSRVTWDFDAEKLVFPIKIRHRKKGDLFYPTGMLGKKKVSKFFKDQKFSVLVKQKIWLLCDGNDQVLGIIPIRQDRRFAASKKHKILRVRL